MHLETLNEMPVDANDVPARRIVVNECGAIAGWNRPPLPLPDPKDEKPATKEELKKEGGLSYKRKLV